MSPRTIPIDAKCPVCSGTRIVSVTRNFSLDPAKERIEHLECGCDDGRVRLLVDVSCIEDAIDDALRPVVDYATRAMDKDAREFVRDDVDRLDIARALLATLNITIEPRQAPKAEEVEVRQ